VECPLCNKEYDGVGICCMDCYPFIKGTFLEKKLQLAKAMDNLAKAMDNYLSLICKRLLPLIDKLPNP
jgi:hypothetical protein